MSESTRSPDRVTIADVAREVGVSMMTISRVINGRDDVSAATRQRVLDAIERMGYRPRSIARGLATRHTGTLGLVVPDIANPFFSEVARGVEQVAYAQGYNVFLCNTDEDPARELDVLGSLEEKRVDGIVLCSSRLGDEDLQMVVDSCPVVVLVNRRLRSEPVGAGQNRTGGRAGYAAQTAVLTAVTAVLVDDVMGGRLAAEHLIGRGHRAIGYLSGPVGSHSGQGRLAGYAAAMASAGLPREEGWTEPCAPTAEQGRTAAAQALHSYPELTALICYNDLVAVGALHACREIGRFVPDDLAIVGFDDIPVAALVTPALTTCRIPRHALGATAMGLLLDRIRGEEAVVRETILEPELVVRASAP
ncbi:MAG: LacI family DNA-binding transcriptional regulator [Anaerolineae bacterium]